MSKSDEALAKLAQLILKHNTLLIGIGNLLAGHALLIKNSLPKCSNFECDNPATCSTHDMLTRQSFNMICDRCLANLIVKAPDELDHWHDLKHAALIRSLNDYSSQVEDIIPDKVH